jgi:hypothetical protein
MTDHADNDSPFAGQPKRERGKALQWDAFRTRHVRVDTLLKCTQRLSSLTTAFAWTCALIYMLASLYYIRHLSPVLFFLPIIAVLVPLLLAASQFINALGESTARILALTTDPDDDAKA